jgi:hypothetical protein
MESSLIARECSTRPRMTTQMKRILMSLGFVLVFEAVITELARILLL